MSRLSCHDSHVRLIKRQRCAASRPWPPHREDNDERRFHLASAAEREAIPRRLMPGDNDMHNPRSFWRQQLRGVLQPELPADQRREPTTGYMAASLPLVIPSDLAASIERLSQTESVPPAVILMATLQSFLSRVTQESDICVGFHLACPESSSAVPVRCKVVRADRSATCCPASTRRSPRLADTAGSLAAISRRCFTSIRDRDKPPCLR